jgi:hypothetical protein
MPTASAVRDPDAYRDSSNRLFDASARGLEEPSSVRPSISKSPDKSKVALTAAYGCFPDHGLNQLSICLSVNIPETARYRCFNVAHPIVDRVSRGSGTGRILPLGFAGRRAAGRWDRELVMSRGPKA